MGSVGRVAELYRYPVKSMRAVAELELELAWHGFAGDREYAFRKSDDLGHFPWFTGRDHADLVLYSARYRDAGAPRKSPIDVVAPDGEAFDLREASLAERLSDEARCDIDLIHIGRGVFDAMPVSVIARGTFERLAAAHGRILETARFRPNIVIEAEDERAWIGATLVFGDSDGAARLRVNRPIQRCAMITIDPATAEHDASVMRSVAQSFNNECGVYCAVERPGIVCAGDEVWLA
jgi:uncharacterized protein